MVEAMVALTLVDHLMMQQAQCELFPYDEAADRPNPLGSTAHREGGAPVQIKADADLVSQRVDEE
jgi:hypothetical protein